MIKILILITLILILFISKRILRLIKVIGGIYETINNNQALSDSDILKLKIR